MLATSREPLAVDSETLVPIGPLTLPEPDADVRQARGAVPVRRACRAARLRTLPLATLAAGLSDRFRLLTTGNRTAYPRHRTPRAVLARSWDR